jgi:hypothetical protein
MPEVPRHFIIRHSNFIVRASSRGATMLAVLMFVMIGAVVISASIALTGARLQQVGYLENEVARHVTWGNSKAINQQYALTWSLRDNITRILSSVNLGNLGGIDADPLIALQAFRSTVRPSNTVVNSYPFNNILNNPSSDHGTFFERTTADSDNSQTEHLAFYNYLKTYPAPLLGDLLIIHKRAAASGSYVFADNFQVNGRVVIWDSTASTANLRADDCINMTKTGTNTVKDTALATMLPQNFPASVTVTAGYGGTTTPTAVSNGTLNLANNTDFTPGSVRHIMEATGILGTTWMNCTTSSNSLTNIDTDNNGGNTTSATRTDLDNTPTYVPPAPAPYGYVASGSLNILTVRLKNPALKHLRITNGVEQLVLEGQTTATDYTAAALLDPVIIWLEQPDCRDIRFVGENSRPLILVTGKGAGATLFCSWSGNSLIGGNALRWRLQWINEYRDVYLDAPNGKGIQIIGSIRTNWSINCTDSTNTVRFTLDRDTAPGDLETMLPRDGWLEPYYLVR